MLLTTHFTPNAKLQGLPNSKESNQDLHSAGIFVDEVEIKKLFWKSENLSTGFEIYIKNQTHHSSLVFVSPQILLSSFNWTHYLPVKKKKFWLQNRCYEHMA